LSGLEGGINAKGPNPDLNLDEEREVNEEGVAIRHSKKVS